MRLPPDFWERVSFVGILIIVYLAGTQQPKSPEAIDRLCARNHNHSIGPGWWDKQRGVKK